MIYVPNGMNALHSGGTPEKKKIYIYIHIIYIIIYIIYIVTIYSNMLKHWKRNHWGELVSDVSCRSTAWTVGDLHTAVVIVSTDLNSSPWKRRHDRCWLGDCWILFTGAFRAGDDSTAADTLGDWKRESKNWRFVPLKTYAILK